MSRMGVSGWMFLLVPAYPGRPVQRAVKRSCVCVFFLHSSNDVVLESIGIAASASSPDSGSEESTT